MYSCVYAWGESPGPPPPCGDVSSRSSCRSLCSFFRARSSSIYPGAGAAATLLLSRWGHSRLWNGARHPEWTLHRGNANLDLVLLGENFVETKNSVSVWFTWMTLFVPVFWISPLPSFVFLVNGWTLRDVKSVKLVSRRLSRFILLSLFSSAPKHNVTLRGCSVRKVKVRQGRDLSRKPSSVVTQ